MRKLPDLNINNYDEIFSMYKQYVDPHITYYKTGCNCSNSIDSLYEEVKRRILDGRIKDVEL